MYAPLCHVIVLPYHYVDDGTLHMRSPLQKRKQDVSEINF